MLEALSTLITISIITPMIGYIYGRNDTDPDKYPEYYE